MIFQWMRVSLKLPNNLLMKGTVFRSILLNTGVPSKILFFKSRTLKVESRSKRDQLRNDSIKTILLIVLNKKI